jgi:hypothetical protein
MKMIGLRLDKVPLLFFLCCLIILSVKVSLALPDSDIIKDQRGNHSLTYYKPSLFPVNGSPLRKDSPYQFGIQMGGGWSGVRGSLDDQKVYSPAIRIYLLKGISPYFSWYGGIGYNRFGYRIQETIPETGSEYEQKHNYRNLLHYIQLPLMLHLSAGSGTRLYLEAGLSAAILTRARMIGYYTRYDAFTGGMEKVELNNKLTLVRSFDAALRLGGGVVIPFTERKRKSNYSLVIGFDSYRGLVNITTENSGITLKNNAFMIDAGLLVSFY